MSSAAPIQSRNAEMATPLRPSTCLMSTDEMPQTTTAVTADARQTRPLLGSGRVDSGRCGGHPRRLGGDPGTSVGPMPDVLARARPTATSHRCSSTSTGAVFANLWPGVDEDEVPSALACSGRCSATAGPVGAARHLDAGRDRPPAHGRPAGRAHLAERGVRGARGVVRREPSTPSEGSCCGPTRRPPRTCCAGSSEPRPSLCPLADHRPVAGRGQRRGDGARWRCRAAQR